MLRLVRVKDGWERVWEIFEMVEMWAVIKRWENSVIRAAVFHHVITPRRDLAEILGLASILDKAGDVILASTVEDAFAVKTGGACYGGSIRSEGYRYRGGKVKQRALSTFDKPVKAEGGPDVGWEDSGFGSLNDMSDDVESYQP